MGCIYQTPVPRGRSSAEEEVERYVRALCGGWLPENSVFQTHELTETDSTHKEALGKFKSDTIPALRRRSRHQVPPITKMLFETDTCWERRNQYPPVECGWVYQSHTTEGSMPRSQYRLHDFIWFCLVCFAFVLVVFVLLLLILF